MESTKILCADSPHKENCKRKPWTSHEDAILLRFISLYGEARWDSIAQASGLNRSGKSCRLRWLNYLRPDLKRTRITSEEEQLIIHLHKRWGNRWSRIAQYLPGRTDNQIKNYFRNHINKKKDIRNSLVKEIQPSDSGSEAQDDWSIYDLDHTLKKTSDLNGAVEAAFAETNVFGFNDEARLFADSISCSAGTLYTSEESFTEYCTDYQLWS